MGLQLGNFYKLGKYTGGNACHLAYISLWSFVKIGKLVKSQISLCLR